MRQGRHFGRRSGGLAQGGRLHARLGRERGADSGEEGPAVQGAEAAIPRHVLIDRTSDLLSNDQDFGAEVKKGVACYKLCDFFEKTGAPWSLKIDKGGVDLLRVAEAEAAKREDAKRKLEEGVAFDESGALAESAKRRRQELIQKARAQRQANPAKARKVQVALG